MLFSAPTWLIGLAPWLAAVAWLLRGQRRKAPVPFLPLWGGLPRQPRQERAIRRPPLALALAMLAMLLAILAAAGPVLSRVGSGNGPPVTILVDRGLSMSALNASGVPRFAELAADVAPALRETLGGGDVELIDVPGSAYRSTRDDWPAAARALPRTALDSAGPLRVAVAAQLLRATGPVLVLSDQPIEHEPGERLILIPPPAPLPHVGIVRLAARANPAPQVMVRLRNTSDRTQATLRVTSGTATAEQRVDLPPAGGERDYFVDLASFADVIEAAVGPVDDPSPDARAWLARQNRPPRLEPRPELPAELRRMVDVYHRAKPPADGAGAVALVRSLTELPAGERAVVVPPISEASATVGTRDLQVTAHPVTAAVRWQAALGDRVHLAGPPPDGWLPIVSAGGQTLVAVREAPARQVWVGFDAPNWPRVADFVVFWTNVFDWVGGDAGYESVPVGSVGRGFVPRDPPPPGTEPGLWPGIYQRADGAIVAVHAPALSPPPATPVDWRANLRRWRQKITPGYRLGPIVLLAALGCVTLSAVTWSVAAADVRMGKRRPARAARPDRAAGPA